jgi:hypothetical protein
MASSNPVSAVEVVVAKRRVVRSPVPDEEDVADVSSELLAVADADGLSVMVEGVGEPHAAKTISNRHISETVLCFIRTLELPRKDGHLNKPL